MSNDPILALLSDLSAARFFEEAAEATSCRMLRIADEVLEASRYVDRGRILRGMVHLRPDDGYRRLWVMENGRRAISPERGYLPSATAWRWVTERRCPVSIDVELGTVRPWLVDAHGAMANAPSEIALKSLDTRERLRERDATHVLVVPLTAPGGGVAGMVSIEARADAIGEEFIWPVCGERLSVVAGVSGPYLTALPMRPSTEPEGDDLLPVVGRSMSGIVDLLRVFSQQMETILLGGPTGVGKSRLARWCHAQSKRKKQPFEALDLLSVPEDLQMGELFGWRRGAFTGAVRDNPGAIARAEGGTLFIDEIDKLSLKAQAGLLHVLEERTYRPMGDASAERKADVRFIVGTNADLKRAVHEGRFREDLYYRINVLPVKVPPLAERLDELPRWAAHMLQRRHREAGSEGITTLTDQAVTALCASAWPGNLRQLDNIIRRACAFALLGGDPTRLTLDKRHVEWALAHEGPPMTPPFIKELQRMATAFVDEAVRREGTAAVLSLDTCEAMKGLVLSTAVERLGSRDAAFRLMGLDGLVKSRNHHRVFRREMERAAELLRPLDSAVADRLAALLADE